MNLRRWYHTTADSEDSVRPSRSRIKASMLRWPSNVEFDWTSCEPMVILLDSHPFSRLRDLQRSISMAPHPFFSEYMFRPICVGHEGSMWPSIRGSAVWEGTRGCPLASAAGRVRESENPQHNVYVENIDNGKKEGYYYSRW